MLKMCHLTVTSIFVKEVNTGFGEVCQNSTLPKREWIKAFKISAADFFKLKKLIKSSRKWRLFGSKLEIFTHKRLYYTDGNSLIFHSYVTERCPTLRQWCFTYDNFNQSLLVAPTFFKRRKLICTPDNIEISNLHCLINQFYYKFTTDKKCTIFLKNVKLISWVWNFCRCLHYWWITSRVSDRIRCWQVSW